MIRYESFQLKNGLVVYVIPDRSINTAVINVAYDVGSRDEDPARTGFAHLFEHLMFGGSVNIPEYDTPLQRVGGENNAFTTSDYTNYYLSIPSNNLETGFWLESDRMLSLSFEQRVLDVQRKVVVEEFKQRYLNKPYGDSWHHLRDLAYKDHPYRWPVIGKDISHIEEAVMDDVRSFFELHYTPDKAVLVVGGDVDTGKVRKLSEKWFEPIERSSTYLRNLPTEPVQKERREMVWETDVPQDALYMAWHMEGRGDRDYYPTDLLSDVLGRGRSSRLYNKLVREKQVFNSVSCHVTGSSDPGLIVVNGFLAEGVDHSTAENAVRHEIEQLRNELIREDEYEKVVSQALSSKAFGRIEILDQAMTLAQGHLLGDPDLLNHESDLISSVTRQEILDSASRNLGDDNASVLYYSKRK